MPLELARPSSARPARRTAGRRPAATARRERLGDDDRAAVDVVRGVVELRVERDRQVRRNRPRRRRPDEHRDVAAGERGHARGELAARSPAPAGTRRRSTARCGPRTRPRLRPAPCGSGCTSAPASCPCRRGPARRTGRSARAIAAWYRKFIVRYGVVPRRRGCRAAGTARVIVPTNRSAYARQARQKSATDISRFFGPELAVDLAARSAGRGSRSRRRRARRSRPSSAT